MTQVVAAIIEREGRILVCRRHPDHAHPLKWEFPGGKIEPGESPREALARELEEELGIHAEVGDEAARYEFSYPGKPPILLIFLHVTRYTGEPRNRIFAEIAWETPDRLSAYDFLAGDVEFVRRHFGHPRYTERMATGIKLADPAGNEFLAQLESKSKGPNHFFRAMANRPETLKNFVPLYASIVGPGTVDRRIKELVYLTCSYANECTYCNAAHAASSKKAGVTEEEQRALQSGQEHIFSAPERAAIEFARELTETSGGEGTREALLQHFNNEQVVEITLVVAIANFTNRFNNGLGVETEE
jgi:8-oxo-dGTP diphosphatase